ncbi:MAG TPA: NAD-dependent epimerase/dehydratase family protein [Solirubrobacteraceae bacterium]|nr:NAD-dependent epimerase/dehydratase family protein [Solirubrobacteraceae bacterium]
MRLLVLGGTKFLGRHVVDCAQLRGHELTLFNRGRTDPRPIPGVEQIHGDREQDLSLLAGRSWDAVIDTSGYWPRAVRASAELLAENVDRYVFVSSISAYGTFPGPGLDEDAPTAPDPPPDVSDVMEHYAELKAACERVVGSVLPGRAIVIRPGLIVGPLDPTNRFTYWVRRLGEGGRVLAPAAPDQPVQLIDVRDLADWSVRMAEQGAAGAYNATGPAETLTFGPLLERIAAATGGGAELVWIDEDRLSEAGVEPWDELPVWLDLPRNAEFRGLCAVDIARALDAGLEFRPLEQTVADTLAWDRARVREPGAAGDNPLPTRAGLSREREAELLARLAG